MLLYVIVFATGLAGMTQLSWWVAAVGGCVLSLKLISEDRPLARRGRRHLGSRTSCLKLDDKRGSFGPGLWSRSPHRSFMGTIGA
jgi:hypothetical protein